MKIFFLHKHCSHINYLTLIATLQITIVPACNIHINISHNTESEVNSYACNIYINISHNTESEVNSYACNIYINIITPSNKYYSQWKYSTLIANAASHDSSTIHSPKTLKKNVIILHVTNNGFLRISQCGHKREHQTINTHNTWTFGLFHLSAERVKWSSNISVTIKQTKRAHGEQ
jgi:hypothetical protein